MERITDIQALKALPEFEIKLDDTQMLTLLTGLISDMTEVHSIIKMRDVPGSEAILIARKVNDCDRMLQKARTETQGSDTTALDILDRNLKGIRKFLEQTCSIRIVSYTNMAIDECISEVDILTTVTEGEFPDKTVIETIEPTVFHHEKKINTAKVIVFKKEN